MPSPGALQNELAGGFGVQRLLPDVQRLYSMLLQSPQFMSMLSQNLGAASQMNNALQSNLARSGVGSSGIGAVLGAAGTSAGQFGETALRGGLFGQALSTALQNQMARLGAYSDLRARQIGQPSALERIFGSILGAGGTALSGPLGVKLFGGK